MNTSDTTLEQLVASLPARVDTNIESARGFPNEAYTSQAFFDLECRRLLPSTWVVAGFAHDIPDPGDVLPTEIGTAPIILLRDQGGDIAAFHNACRHRGAMLVDAACRKQARLVCPYHAWTYDLDGTLIARPYFDGRENTDQALPADQHFNLQRVRVAQWQDLIFVNLSGDAPPLEKFLGPLVGQLNGYDLSALGYAGALEFEVSANWKFAGENFIEQYHVFRAHSSLVGFAPMNTRNPGKWRGAVFSTHYQFPKLESGRGAGLPHFPGLSAEMQKRGIWFYVYPNLGIEIFPDQMIVFRAIPLAPDKMREEIHIYLIERAATGKRYQKERQQVFDSWHSLNLEDVGLLEALQRGRSSPSYDGGVFSRQWEQPTADYSKLIAQGLLQKQVG